MKRNRESQCRMNIISSKKLNKSNQRELDASVSRYKNLTYYDLYDAIVKLNYEHLEQLISSIIDYEMESVVISFGDINNLLGELFDRPYYLGIDFLKGTDTIGEITYKGKKIIKENT